MNEADLKARLNELYLPPADDFVLVQHGETLRRAAARRPVVGG